MADDNFSGKRKILSNRHYMSVQMIMFGLKNDASQGMSLDKFLRKKHEDVRFLFSQSVCQIVIQSFIHSVCLYIYYRF